MRAEAEISRVALAEWEAKEPVAAEEATDRGKGSLRGGDDAQTQAILRVSKAFESNEAPTRLPLGEGEMLDDLDMERTKFCVIPQVSVEKAMEERNKALCSSRGGCGAKTSVEAMCTAFNLRHGRPWEVPYFFPYIALML